MKRGGKPARLARRCGILIGLAAAFAPLETGCDNDSIVPAQSSLPLEVTVEQGTVRGALTGEGAVRAFRAIPYAAPPIGPLRWKAPQPAPAWSSPREATSPGIRCMQTTLAGTIADRVSEDCLHLDVYTPARAAVGEKLPVMVWFHGGGFITGSNSDEIYELTKLAKGTKAMLVAVNYRLGALGFLAHPDLSSESPPRGAGNYGLLDQSFALEWVKKNAAAFGGDPDAVTIFGESAGGISVALHAVSPKSAGLFHRAVVQSGPPTLIPATTVAEGAKQATDLGKALGCNGADLIACLRGKPADAVTTALRWAPGAKPAGTLLQGSVPTAVYPPTVDGVFLPEDPSSLYERGALAKVPYIVGSNAAEGNILAAGVLGDVPVKTPADYTKALEISFGENASKVAEKYPVTAFKDASEALARVVTVGGFTCPTRTLSRRIARAGAPLFVYHLERGTQGGVYSGFGATHAAELIFLFDYESTITGSAGDDGAELVRAMHGYWSAFARRGDPNDPTMRAWPAFAAGSRHLVLDVPLREGENLGAQECDFWDNVRFALPKSYSTPP